MTEIIDPTEPIAIIGLGGLFPGAGNIAQYWQNILEKKNSITEIPIDRWDWRLYYDPNPSTPDKTYSKIGGFVQNFTFNPLALRIPPPVAKQMDSVQQLAVVATAQALKDSGYDAKSFDNQRAAVIFGNSMGGPKKEASDLRIYASAFYKHLSESPSFKSLDSSARTAIASEVEQSFKAGMCTITEDTMPGELSNVIAGRVANTFNLNGPNFTVDAACAASLAALAQAVNGLRFRHYDMAVCGGVDQMMAPPAYVKFCKIGALSPDGSRPFDADANGFVMGEGVGVYVLKRLSDARKDGDRIYALIRAIGASSDGRGKGITAPNPKGQKLAIERTFDQVDYAPQEVGLLEAHGTSTKVGDVVEVQTATEVFKNVPKSSIALGSVKSQIGHLKAAAGAASLVKVALALHHKILPPTINFKTPNMGIDWAHSPFRVQSETEPWPSKGKARRAHVSAFGFGGTNFHVALEEANDQTLSWTPALAAMSQKPSVWSQAESTRQALDPALGAEALLLKDEKPQALLQRLADLRSQIPESPLTTFAYASSQEKKGGKYLLGIAAESGPKLKEKIDLILACNGDIWEKPPMSFKPKGIHLGRKKSQQPKIGFMFPGQGSQYVDMLKDLREKYQVVADTFAEADEILLGLIGEKLSDLLFTQGGETPEKIAAMQERIKQTEITQPAVLTADIALLRLLASYGVEPDIVCGHSLGEYGALVASGIMEFKDALLAVSSRAKEMAGVRVEDPGKMLSIAAPVEKIEPVLKEISGYVICANKNCPSQTVIAGETRAVEQAAQRFSAQGLQVQFIEVSHAFHSKIVAPAQKPYARFLERIVLKPPKIPILSNVTADYYPQNVAGIRELMVSQMVSPVEFIRQAERMYADGVRVFIEVGPKRALAAFIASTLEAKKDVIVAPSNHPKRGGVQEFNDLLARLHAAGIELRLHDPASRNHPYTQHFSAWVNNVGTMVPAKPSADTTASELLQRWDIHLGPVVVSGISAGVPGSWDKVFREDALDCLIAGNNLIEKLPEEEQRKQLAKNLERVVKSETGAHSLQKMESIEQVIRLAARAGEFDMGKEFGIRGSISSLLDKSYKLAIAAGLLALKDAGIPLIRHYKKTTTGSLIPTTWGLPEPLSDETGVIFATAFPGLHSLIEDISRYFADKYVGKPSRELWEFYDRLLQKMDPAQRRELTQWYLDYRQSLGPAADTEPYSFSRSFLLRVLSLGHAQMSQILKARGPCTQVNAACASTTQAVGIAEDWIRLGRAKRVLVIAADDITDPTLMEWLGTGFLATGATTTKNAVSEAALPFDRRRNGMIIGMGAVGMVLEAAHEVERRGMRPLAELLATQFDNSAFHVTRLNTQHVCEVMDRMVSKAERRHGLSRSEIAGKMLFMSHETYTPAQGGSSAAEVEALKATFGADVGKIVVTNTKGFTGHSMGASLEDVVAVRAMNAGRLPPIANYKEPDPELTGIQLSRGGNYDCEYALRLGAGFGSQIAMTLMKRRWRISEPRIQNPEKQRAWLKEISGMPTPELEIVHNTLRIQDTRPAPKTEQPTERPKTPTPTELPKPTPAIPLVALNQDNVQTDILRLVSEKTGYPPEMLELDLDMEADLGIDTVKQAELIGLIREKYNIPRQENLSLKDYPTLRHILRFVLAGAAAPKAASITVTVAAPEHATNGSQAKTVPIAKPPQHADIMTQAEPSQSVAAVPQGLDESKVHQDIAALVSEKTGYPPEMLELDLDMEADLGIDTVKQAELIGLIREKYNIPRQENLSLKDYPTMRHIIRFVLAGATAPKTAPVTETAPAPKSAVAQAPAGTATLQASMSQPATSTPVFQRWVLEAYPKPARHSGKHLHLARGPVVLLAPDVETAKPFSQAIEKQGGSAVTSLAVDWTNPQKAGEKLRAALKGKKAQGLLDLTGLGLESFQNYTSAAFDKAYARSVRAAFLLAKALRQDFADSPKECWMLTLTRMDGAHGCAGTAFNPLAGALTGLAKALRKELGLRVQALDFDIQELAQIAQTSLQELDSGDPGMEIGFSKGQRWALRLVPKNSQTTYPSNMTAESTVLVTGGGQGLGAELAKEIAKRYKPTLILIGRTALTQESDSWDMSEEGLKVLKMRLWENLKKDKTRKATPALLEREFSKIAKAAELRRNIEEMERAGSKVLYLAADLGDGAQAAKALKAALKAHENIDWIIHAAGLESSKLLGEKQVEDFDQVFRVKAHGALNLLQAIPRRPAQNWVFFSSVVGRFGNIGQTDYAAASDFLAKLAAALQSDGQNAVALDLTAFSEIGMATRGGVETFLKSQGVDFLSPKLGVSLILEEILNPNAPEVLIAGGLGALDSDHLMDAQNAKSESAGKVTSTKTFSLESDPWLRDHAIAGVPYVAGVMGLELFAQSAQKLTGRAVSGFSQVRFALPIKLLRNRPIAVRTEAVKKDAGVELAIQTDFVTASGIKLGDPRIHFTARLANGALDATEKVLQDLPLTHGTLAVQPQTIYTAYFHGPSFQVLAGVVSLSEQEVLAIYEQPKKPLWPQGQNSLLFQPLLVEAAFQACGYRDLHFARKMTLPDSIDRVQILHGETPKKLYVHAKYKGSEEGGKSVYDAFVFDENRRLWASLRGYRMIAIS